MQKSNYVKIFSSIISEDFKTTSFRIIVHNVWLQMCIFTSSLHTKNKAKCNTLEFAEGRGRCRRGRQGILNQPRCTHLVTGRDHRTKRKNVTGIISHFSGSWGIFAHFKCGWRSQERRLKIRAHSKRNNLIKPLQGRVLRLPRREAWHQAHGNVHVSWNLPDSRVRVGRPPDLRLKGWHAGAEVGSQNHSCNCTIFPHPCYFTICKIPAKTDCKTHW